jgi:hypothetical protein
VLGALTFAAILGAPPGRAAGCAATGPYVVITAPHPAPANVDVPAVIERLREELASRGVELCAGAPPAPAAPALATVRLEASAAGASPSSESVALDIEVRDEVTAKRVGREIDLSTTPRDGRGVVVALAADELLRASWAELSLERVPKPSVPIPSEVRAALAPTIKSQSRFGFGVRGAGEWWSGGLSLFGADADVSLHLASRWSLHASGGVRVALDLDAPDGTVSARAATFRLGPDLALTDPRKRPALLSWGAGVVGYVVQLAATPTALARSNSETRAALAFETGPALHVPIPDAGVSITIAGAFAVAGRGPALFDGSTRVAALSGVAGMASIGLGTP